MHRGGLKGQLNALFIAGVRVINGRESQLVDIDPGVPHGSILGQMIFFIILEWPIHVRIYRWYICEPIESDIIIICDLARIYAWGVLYGWVLFNHVKTNKLFCWLPAWYLDHIPDDYTNSLGVGIDPFLWDGSHCITSYVHYTVTCEVFLNPIYTRRNEWMNE